MSRTTEASLKESNKRRAEIHATLAKTRNWGKNTGISGKRSIGRKLKSGYGASLKYSDES